MQGQGTGTHWTYRLTSSKTDRLLQQQVTSRRNLIRLFGIGGSHISDVLNNLLGPAFLRHKCHVPGSKLPAIPAVISSPYDELHIDSGMNAYRICR